MIDPDDDTATARLRALARLKDLLCGPIHGHDAVYHYCPVGCHPNRAAAVDDIFQNLCILFLYSPPGVPAYNKWTKTYPPVPWFASFLNLGQLLPAAVSKILDRVSEEDLEMHEDDLQGLDTDLSFKREEQKRFRRTHQFLSTPGIDEKMAACCIAMMPSLEVMGSLFTSSRRFGALQELSVLTLLNPGVSPAMRCIRKYIAVLRDEDSACWQSLVGGGRAWSSELYVLASAPMLFMVGSLHKRFFLVLDRWPWRLGRLVSDDVDIPTKQTLARELMEACACCLDSIARAFKAKCADDTDVLSPPKLQYLRDLFANTPLTNIGSENRFAAAQTRWCVIRGHVGVPPTLASGHVLSEAKLLNTAERLCPLASNTKLTKGQP